MAAKPSNTNHRDPHIHTPNDVIVANIVDSIIANPYATTATACGRRRDLSRVSTNPTEVTCSTCRTEACRQHELQASVFASAASLASEAAGDRRSCDSDHLDEAARKHRTLAELFREDEGS